MSIHETETRAVVVAFAKPAASCNSNQSSGKHSTISSGKHSNQSSGKHSNISSGKQMLFSILLPLLLSYMF